MKLYGLIGKPLTHSFSKTYFTTKFAALKVDCRYENFELPAINSIIDLVKEHPDLCGLNVTIPYKEVVLPFLDFTNEVVQEVGACNCIKIEDGKLFGYNTDVIGFKISLEEQLKHKPEAALILGTGGAAKAVAYALKLSGIKYQFVSRNVREETISYRELNRNIIEKNTLIINTTPLGMFPKIEEAPELPYEFITPKHLLFDLTYNPEKTLFLKRGEERGAAIANGYKMLVIQAEESWKIWND